MAFNALAWIYLRKNQGKEKHNYNAKKHNTTL